ncbi:MAG: flagellar brake protein [Gammaproteobacteria bacterium]|nr:flagellar brake protein [Gammaproteobacteria bacterium]
MTEDRLKLRVGEKLQLQRTVGDQDERLKVTVIGYLTGQSLIVTAPIVKGKLIYINEGQEFAVRMLDEQHAWGFVSTVIHTASKPYPYMHLEYPHDVESATIRKSGRIQASVPCLAKSREIANGDGGWYPVMIRDLSTSGARFHSIHSLGQAGDRLDLKFNLSVRSLNEKVEILATLRNVGEISTEEGTRHSKAAFSIGVEFLEVNRFRELLISHYILERMMECD